MLVRWESGRRHPTAAEFFRLAEKAGIDVRAALRRFFASHLTDPLADFEVGTPEHAAELLRLVVLDRTRVELAELTGSNRFAIARILKGTSEARLPTFLRILHAATKRVLDLIAVFTDPGELPSVRDAWDRLEAYRRLAYDHPLSEAALALLETEAQRNLDRYPPGWLAARLGIDESSERAMLASMERAGVVERVGGRISVARARHVDTQRDPRGNLRLKQFWADETARRFDEGAGGGQLSYLVTTVSQENLERIAELSHRYYFEMLALARASEGAERVVALQVHVCPMDGDALRPVATSAC